MLARINRTLPGLFEDFFQRDFFPVFEYDSFKSIPSVNIVEGKDEYTIEVAAPGLNKKDFNISLDNNCLTITSEKEDKVEEKEGKFTKREFSYSSFRRSFTLPETVDSEKIKARHSNGILYVTVPKKEESKIKPIRQIAIS